MFSAEFINYYAIIIMKNKFILFTKHNFKCTIACIQMAAIHHHLGVCPQFDIQYPELTAEEHLLFYARLKGVKFGRTRKVVDRALKQVRQ